MGKALAKASGSRPDSAQTGGHLDIRLFGHLEIALDGARFKLATPRKSLQVLAYVAFEVRSRYESPLWSSTTLANFAIWNAALGNLEAARNAIRRLLADETAIMRTTDWPSRCYWAAAKAFRCDGNAKEAARALARARRLMEENAAGLDPEDRESFLLLPWHLDLSHAISAGVWPDPAR